MTPGPLGFAPRSASGRNVISHQGTAPALGVPRSLEACRRRLSAWIRLTTSCGLCGDVSSKRVLDLGCGRGDSTLALRVTRSEGDRHRPLRRSTSRTRAVSPRKRTCRVELRHGDLADLAFLPPASVDVAFSGSALTHVIDTGRVFRQVHRVLKTGAPFVLLGRASRCRASAWALRTGAATRSRSLRRAAARQLRGRHVARTRSRRGRAPRARADDARHARPQARALTPVVGLSSRGGSPTTRRAAASPPPRPARLRRAELEQEVERGADVAARLQARGAA